MKRTHELKTLPEYFQALWDRTKTFEVRLDDRSFAVGDQLRCREFLPDKWTGHFGHRAIDFEVTYKMHGGKYGLHHAWCVLGLKELSREDDE